MSLTIKPFLCFVIYIRVPNQVFMKRILLIAVVMLLFITDAMSQTATPGINARQRRQQQRIANGIRSGELTPAETANLERKEAKIQREKAAYKSTGVVTPLERRHLKREQNQLDRQIYRAKHNARVQH